MRKDWIKIVPQIIDNFDNIIQILCPNCKECEIEYLYIGDERTRVGFLQVWCNKCLKGIHISRAKAPQNAKFVTFDYDIDNMVPFYDEAED